MHRLRRFKGFSIFAAISLVFLTGAAPSRGTGTTFDDRGGLSLKQVQEGVSAVRLQVQNQQVEFRILEEKLHTHEEMIETLRDQITDAGQANRNIIKDTNADLEMKIGSLETTTKGLIADLKQLKNHANESSAALAQANQQIAVLQETIKVQNQNLDSLQAAIKALADALQVKVTGPKAVAATAPADGNSKVYRVKSGDSLEKIARANQTTIQALKELNGLSNDRITVGQSLQLPNPIYQK